MCASAWPWTRSCPRALAEGSAPAGAGKRSVSCVSALTAGNRVLCVTTTHDLPLPVNILISRKRGSSIAGRGASLARPDPVWLSHCSWACRLSG